MIGNHKPQISGNDEGIWRRVHLVPFNVKVPEAQRDPDLTKKLLSESAGILNWLLSGCQDWLTNGLKAPPAVVGATQQYREESDILRQFIDECCNEKLGVSFAKADFYKAYRNWALSNGHHPWAAKRLGQRMADQNFQEIRNGKVRSWSGVNLNPVGQRFLIT